MHSPSSSRFQRQPGGGAAGSNNMNTINTSNINQRRRSSHTNSAMEHLDLSDRSFEGLSVRSGPSHRGGRGEGDHSHRSHSHSLGSTGRITMEMLWEENSNFSVLDDEDDDDDHEVDIREVPMAKASSLPADQSAFGISFRLWSMIRGQSSPRTRSRGILGVGIHKRRHLLKNKVYTPPSKKISIEFLLCTTLAFLWGMRLLFSERQHSSFALQQSQSADPVFRGLTSVTVKDHKQALKQTDNHNTILSADSHKNTTAAMLAAFPEPYVQKLWNQPCQKDVQKRIPQLRDYLQSLDLSIVSHGGVGSNALIDHLEEHQVHTKGDREYYIQSCHLGNPMAVSLLREPSSATTPTLVIVGDIENAVLSMKRRNWLHMNIAKNLLASQGCRQKLKNWRKNVPEDPLGIFTMMQTYIAQSPESVVFVRAPYTQESLQEALRLLGLPAQALDDFTVQPRSSRSESETRALLENEPLIETLFKSHYRPLQKVLDAQPAAWKAGNTSDELRDMLHERFWGYNSK